MPATKDPALCQDLTVLGRVGYPPISGQPHKLVECVIKIRDSMAPLTTFTEAEVFDDMEQSCWVWVTQSKSQELEEPKATQERSHSQNNRAHPQGFFSSASGGGCTKGPAIPPQ